MRNSAYLEKFQTLPIALTEFEYLDQICRAVEMEFGHNKITKARTENDDLDPTRSMTRMGLLTVTIL